MLSPADAALEAEDRYLVAVLTSFYVPAYLGGGPIQTLKALVDEAPNSADVRVVCANHDLGETARLVDRPNEWQPVDRAQVRYVSGGLRQLIAAFRDTAQADIVYLNSLFSPHYSVLPLILRAAGRWRGAEVLVAPRGELYPGALAQKSWKKKIFLRAFALLRLSEKVTWHASTEEEANLVRTHFGENARIAVREDETSLPRTAQGRAARAGGPLRLLFASRVHPQKGLDIVLAALADMPEPVDLQVVGAFVNEDYERHCAGLAAQLPEHISVEFHGGLPREEVLGKMREADLVVLPTASENFGHVIAEALSESCPVMCSQYTPWAETLDAGGGVVVAPNTAEAWAVALRDYAGRGTEVWHGAAEDAGEAYDAWRRAPKGEHVFDLLRAQTTRV